MKKKAVVVVIRGPAGTGKTTAALLLRDRMEPAVRLSVDTLRYLATPRTLDRVYLRVAKVAAARMAVEYAAAGISSVLDSVFMDVQVLEEVLEILRRANVEHYVFTLRTKVDEAQRRDARRDQFMQVGAERVKELYEAFSWVGNVVDTDGRIVEEVVSEILERLENLRAGRDDAMRGRGERRLCFFMRHGLCELDLEQYQPHDAVSLSEAGRAAVAATASALVGFGAKKVVASPFRRARETAQIVGEVLQLDVEVEPDLAERHFASLAGRSYAMLRGEYGDEFVERLTSRSEKLELDGEETFAAARTRIVSTMESIMRGAESRVVVVSHGGPNSWLLSHYLGMRVDRIRAMTLAPAHGSVFAYDTGGRFSKVVAINVSGWDESVLA